MWKNCRRWKWQPASRAKDLHRQHVHLSFSTCLQLRFALNLFFFGGILQLLVFDLILKSCYFIFFEFVGCPVPSSPKAFLSEFWLNSFMLYSLLWVCIADFCVIYLFHVNGTAWSPMLFISLVDTRASSCTQYLSSVFNFLCCEACPPSF